MKKSRGLDQRFMENLQNGFLKEIPATILKDSTLEFQIRCNQIHIYYRGGKIWDINKNKANDNFYTAIFDKKYLPENSVYKKKVDILPELLTSTKDVSTWISSMPYLKQLIDEYSSTRKDRAEREYQQHVVRVNNHSKVSNGTDYFIVDIEYAKLKARFDMVAFKWPSEVNQRKNPLPDLALIEMKFGDGAYSGKSGLRKHVEDAESFLGDADSLKIFKQEMISVFQQKRDLGLIKGIGHNKNRIDSISKEPPELILLLDAHDPASANFKNELITLSPMKNAVLKIATANFMGYSLYKQGMLEIEAFKDIYSDRIYSGNR